MKLQTIILEKKDNIAKVILNRPEVLNAMNPQMLMELKTVFTKLKDDDDVYVVIVAGSGRAFSSGMDIKTELPPNFANLEIEMFEAVSNLGKPTIAAVNGYCVTGGLTLPLNCDMIIASEDAVFGDTHVRLGTLTHAGGASWMARLMGPMRAKEFLLTSGFMSAKEAEKVGLVNRVVPVDKLQEEAEELAKKIAAQPQEAVRRMKSVIDRGIRADLASSLLLEQVEFRRIREESSEELKERVEITFEKGKEIVRKIAQE